MTTPAQTIEVKIERTIPASPNELFDAWLDPKVPGNPWNEADKFVLDPKVDGLYFWSIKGTSHYGRFTEMQRPARMQQTWMSPNTGGLESVVTVTFEKKGKETLMTLVHSGLPDTNQGRGHEKGWTYFLGKFAEGR